MGLVRLFLITLGFFVLLTAVDLYAALPLKVQMEIADIDEQIEELEEIKRGYEAKALRHEDHAWRLQFRDQLILETRRHIELAAENREMAARVQKEIDSLKKRRMLLLRYNGADGRLPPPGGDGFEDI